jgi:hypothetical protein
MKTTTISAFAILTALISPAFAGPLKEAKINQIVNDVKVIEPSTGARPASLQDVIKDNLGVATGIQSRAELLFQDDTLTRLGPETFFSFQPGTRNINLERGSMLLQVPKNLGGAHIRAASVSASITGTTIMVEHLSGERVKIVVLEGSLKVGINNLPNNSMMLPAGKMVIIPPDAKEFPKPQTANLRQIVVTSALVNPKAFQGESKHTVAVLPSMPLIEKEIAKQEGTAQADSAATAPTESAHVSTDNTNSNSTDTSTTAPTNSSTTTSSSSSGSTTTATSSSGGTNGSASGGTSFVPGTGSTNGPVSTTTTPPANIATLPTSTPAPVVTAPTPAPTPVPVPTYPSGPAFVTNPIPLFPYFMGNNTTFNTGAQTVVTFGVTNAGGLYSNSAVSGPASKYLFDSTSAFDTASNFDSKFSIQDQGSAPTAGVAVYRFTNLLGTDVPTVNTAGGPVDLALVGQQSIITSGGGNWHVDALRSLFMGTVSGPVSLGTSFEAQSNSGFKFLQLYARGSTGSVTLGGDVNIQGASLFVDAQAGINVASGGSVEANKAVLNTPGSVVVNGNLQANLAQITAGSSISINKQLNITRLEATGASFTTTKNVTASTGFLNIGAGGIQTSGQNLTGFDTIDSVGGMDAGNVTANSYVHIGGQLTTSANGGQATITAPDISIRGGVNFTGANNSAGGNLTLLSDSANISATGINGIKADGADALLSLSQGSNGGTVNIGTTSKPVTNNVTVDKPISATTGANGLLVTTGGNGGTVNVVANGSINVNSLVKVSDSAAGRASNKGGNINLSSNKTTGTAINITSSGQLLALLATAAPGQGGTVKVYSAGGDIVVNGGTVKADKGTVDIRNNGAGNISVKNANINGDVVKIGALGPNGTLTVGGGTINADSTLKLYGGSTNGQVHFTDNVTLGGNSNKIIAGKTVTIDNLKTVTIGGTAPAQVYSDNRNFSLSSGGNGTTSGAFGGAGANVQGFSSHPAF